MAEQASGIQAIFVAINGTPTGDPVTVPADWEGPMPVLGGSTPNLPPNNQADGAGKPLYVDTVLDWTVEVPDLSFYNPMKAHDTAEDKLIVAMQKLDNSFEYLQSVEVSADLTPKAGAGQFNTFTNTFAGIAEDPDELLTDAPEWAV